MVEEKLYINGEAVDMGNDTINLTYENNLFGAVDALKLSFSYTFTLPHSLINDKIFKQGYAPATGCDALRKYFPCSYERGGVEVLRGSLCVNNVTARGYSCCVVWGLDALKTMSAEKVKLWLLPQGTRHQGDTLRLSSAPAYNNTADFLGGPFFGYARYYGGLTPEICRLNEKPAVLPCVNVKYILSLIKERYNITLQFPTSRDALINKMVIALTGSFVWREGMPTPRGAFMLDKNYSEQYGYQAEFIPTATANGVIYQRHNVETDEYYFTTTQNVTLNNLRIEITDTVQFNVNSAVFGNHVAEYDNARGLWVVVISGDGVTFAEGEKFALTLAPHDTPDVYPHTWLRDLQLVRYDFDVKADGKGLKDGANYFIPANLPDITAVDFIKELCILLGVTPVKVTEGAAGSSVIVCESLDEILTRQPDNLDANAIAEVTPHYKEFARENVYKFKVNEFQPNEYAASITTEDETLEPTRDAFVSSFSSLVGLNVIPLFSASGTAADIKITENSINNVICLLDTTQTVATLTQRGLTFGTLLANYYATLAEIMRAPVIVSVTARLSPSQEKELNAARCYYVPMLANYYLPIKTETDGNVYKLELIKTARGTTPTPTPPPDVVIITDFNQYFWPCWIGKAYGVPRWEQSGPYNTGVIIPLGEAVTVIIKTTQYHSIEYAFLTDTDRATELGAPPHFAQGYTDVITAQANAETTIQRPANAQYFYIKRVYDAGYQLPENVKLIY